MCVLEKEIEAILGHYHNLECGGHFGGNKIATKVLQLEFYWETLFKDAHVVAMTYDHCQRM